MTEAICNAGGFVGTHDYQVVTLEWSKPDSYTEKNILRFRRDKMVCRRCGSVVEPFGDKELQELGLYPMMAAKGVR